MRKFIIETEIERFENIHDLPEDEQELLVEAKKAMNDAYAPYSQFYVGASILLANGIIQKGNNQENAAYPSGLCAERVAIFAAGANNPGIEIRKIAITAQSKDFALDHPVAPCGACRQSMLEYEMKQKSPITILMQGRTGDIFRVHGIRQLLPIYFHEEGLMHK